MRDVAGPAEKSGDVGQIDDVAAIFFQQWRGSLRAEKWGFEIYVERGIPGFFGGGGEFRVEEIGGVVDEDVEAAEFFAAFANSRSMSDFLARSAAREMDRRPRFDFGHNFFGVVARLVIVHDDVGAFGGQMQRDGAAQAFSRPGNHEATFPPEVVRGTNGGHHVKN